MESVAKSLPSGSDKLSFPDIIGKIRLVSIAVQSRCSCLVQPLCSSWLRDFLRFRALWQLLMVMKFPFYLQEKPVIFKFLHSMGKKKASKNCFFKACFFFLARGSNELLQTGAKRLPYYSQIIPTRFGVPSLGSFSPSVMVV